MSEATEAAEPIEPDEDDEDTTEIEEAAFDAVSQLRAFDQFASFVNSRHPIYHIHGECYDAGEVAAARKVVPEIDREEGATVAACLRAMQSIARSFTTPTPSFTLDVRHAGRG